MSRMMFYGRGKLCNERAPWKIVKIRRRSAPWITNEISYKIKNRYKIFKAAVNTKCPDEVRSHSSPKKSQSILFTKMFEEVKKTSAYWNLINKATNRIERNRAIGPLRRDDGSLALLDKEEAQWMNSHFTAIGENLINSLPMSIQR